MGTLLDGKRLRWLAERKRQLRGIGGQHTRKCEGVLRVLGKGQRSLSHGARTIGQAG